MTQVSRIAVLSKQPPGGRCALYMRFSEAISRYLDIPFELSYRESGRDLAEIDQRDRVYRTQMVAYLAPVAQADASMSGGSFLDQRADRAAIGRDDSEGNTENPRAQRQ